MRDDDSTGMSSNFLVSFTLLSLQIRSIFTLSSSSSRSSSSSSSSNSTILYLSATLHVAPSRASHVTRHTSNITRHTSHVTRHTSLLPPCALCCSGLWYMSIMLHFLTSLALPPCTPPPCPPKHNNLVRPNACVRGNPRQRVAGL